MKGLAPGGLTSPHGAGVDTEEGQVPLDPTVRTPVVTTLSQPNSSPNPGGRIAGTEVSRSARVTHPCYRRTRSKERPVLLVCLGGETEAGAGETSRTRSESVTDVGTPDGGRGGEWSDRVRGQRGPWTVRRSVHHVRRPCQ